MLRLMTGPDWSARTVSCAPESAAANAGDPRRASIAAPRSRGRIIGVVVGAGPGETNQSLLDRNSKGRSGLDHRLDDARLGARPRGEFGDDPGEGSPVGDPGRRVDA